MSTDTIVQVALAISLAVLSIVSGVVGWLAQIAIRKLIERLNQFGEFITTSTAHKAATDVRLTGHDQRLDHHQRWLETHEGRLSTVCKAQGHGERDD